MKNFSICSREDLDNLILNDVESYFNNIGHFSIIPSAGELDVMLSVARIDEENAIIDISTKSGLEIIKTETKRDHLCITMWRDGRPFAAPAAAIRPHICGSSSDLVNFSRSVLPANCSARVILLEKSALCASLAALLDGPVMTSLRFDQKFEIGSSALVLLDHLISLVQLGMNSAAPWSVSALAQQTLLELVHHVVLTAMPHNFSEILLRPVACPLPRHVRRAVDYIQAHADQPLTLQDVTLVAGVSERALQVGFRRFLDTTPRAFLEKIRLENAHRDLTHAPGRASVTEVATKWGFMHLGRFSSLYRRSFGVSPSDSLRRGAVQV
jgi:AraC-like DNA-binding protein